MLGCQKQLLGDMRTIPGVVKIFSASVSNVANGITGLYSVIVKCW